MDQAIACLMKIIHIFQSLCSGLKLLRSHLYLFLFSSSALMLECELGEIISSLEPWIVEVLNIFVSIKLIFNNHVWSRCSKLYLPCELFENGILGKLGIYRYCSLKSLAGGGGIKNCQLSHFRHFKVYLLEICWLDFIIILCEWFILSGPECKLAKHCKLIIFYGGKKMLTNLHYKQQPNSRQAMLLFQ